jgi:hypothetical protein
MKRVILFGALAVSSMVYLMSCYNNKTDITSLPTVSFVNEVAPILTSGACGCHNNGGTSAKQFSNLVKNNNGGDTVYYDAIYSEANVLADWANGVTGHPAGGGVTLSSSAQAIIQNWAAQGFPDDQSSGSAGSATYSGNIASIVSSTCGGGSCHGTNGGGAAGPALNFTTLTTTLSSTLEGYVNNNWSGHGGGPQSPSVTSEFKAWIAAGMPQ